MKDYEDLSGDKLYKQAVSDVKDLVEYVLNECDEFSDRYNYEKEWVRDRFREEFNKTCRKERNNEKRRHNND